MTSDHLKVLFGTGGCATTALAEGKTLILRLTGGCMQPDLADQSEVRLDRPRFFTPGDVVAFHCPRQDRLLVHRFLGYIWRKGAWKVMTMADRGSRPDPLTDASRVFGRVISHGGRTYRISPARRMEAMWQYVRCCTRRFYYCARRLVFNLNDQ